MNKKILSMPSLDNYSSRKEWETACWQKLLTSKEMVQILTTAHERHNLTLRAVTLDRLQAGKSYRDIGKELFLSQQTISLIKKVLDGKLYESYSERSKKERKPKTYSPYHSYKKKEKGKLVRTKYGTKRISHPLY